MNKKYIGLILAAGLAAGVLWGCAGEKEAASASGDSASQGTEVKGADKNAVLGGNIGISFPSKDDGKRVQEAEAIKETVVGAGYEAQIQYAGNDGKTQAEQLTKMIDEKVNCLVVLPVDSAPLVKALEAADKQGITVISYDDLIVGTDKISYYVGFDDKTIGKDIGSYIAEEQKLDNAKADKKKFTIEFFMGALNDGNSKLRMEGMLEVLTPYMELGVLECRSYRTAYEDASIAKASGEIAAQTCDNIMKANYLDDPVDVVCAGSDELIPGIVKALKEQSNTEKEWPILTGAGGTEEAFARIADGTQAMTVSEFDDSLVELCADIIEREIQGEEQSNLKSCNNGTADIPAAFGKAKVVYKDNYKQIMEDRGITLPQKK